MSREQPLSASVIDTLDMVNRARSMFECCHMACSPLPDEYSNPISTVLDVALEELKAVAAALNALTDDVKALETAA